MRRGRVGAALAAGAAALLAAGCGTGGLAPKQADTQSGQKVFVASCGACHTLAAANTRGTIGPNLDSAFASDRAQGYKQDSIENVVLDQIRLGSGSVHDAVHPSQIQPSMPANIVTGQDAINAAAYVASVAGQNGASPASPASLGTNGKKIFQTECGSCHTLAAAGTTGTVGPNLDQLKPAEARVVRQVTNGGAIMPAFKGVLSVAQIAAVAKFVSSSAGK